MVRRPHCDGSILYVTIDYLYNFMDNIGGSSLLLNDAQSSYAN